MKLDKVEEFTFEGRQISSIQLGVLDGSAPQILRKIKSRGTTPYTPALTVFRSQKTA